MNDDARPWIDAWHDALYGPAGFYRRDEGPAGHFATSVQGVPGVDEVLAQTVVALAERIDAEVVVDFACGRGELATSLLPFVAIDDDRGGSARPDVEVIAVDVVDRPATLDQRITWVRSPGGADVAGLDVIGGRRALVIAHEWLDVVPCVVAEADDDGVLREVLVGADGSEALGSPLAPEDARWADTSSPGTIRPIGEELTPPQELAPAARNRLSCKESTQRRPGERVEVGRTRDAAWEALGAELRRSAAAGSVVVGVDYGFTATTRNPLGTLTGFRDGSECPPTPDGSCDITSHVALDSLDVDTVSTQRDLMLDLFGTEPLAPVPIDLATSDPAAYLARLATRSALATAVHPDGLGGFFWFTKSV